MTGAEYLAQKRAGQSRPMTGAEYLAKKRGVSREASYLGGDEVLHPTTAPAPDSGYLSDYRSTPIASTTRVAPRETSQIPAGLQGGIDINRQQQIREGSPIGKMSQFIGERMASADRTFGVPQAGFDKGQPLTPEQQTYEDQSGPVRVLSQIARGAIRGGGGSVAFPIQMADEVGYAVAGPKGATEQVVKGQAGGLLQMMQDAPKQVGYSGKRLLGYTPEEAAPTEADKEAVRRGFAAPESPLFAGMTLLGGIEGMSKLVRRVGGVDFNRRNLIAQEPTPTGLEPLTENARPPVTMDPRSGVTQPTTLPAITERMAPVSKKAVGETQSPPVTMGEGGAKPEPPKGESAPTVEPVKTAKLTFAEEARARINARTKKGDVNLGALGDWEQAANLKDYAIIGAEHIANGTIKFAEWSTEMVKEFGEQIKPYLTKIYIEARKAQGEGKGPINTTRMNVSETGKETIKGTIDEMLPDLEALKGAPLTKEEVLAASETSDALTRVMSRDATKEIIAANTRATAEMLQAAEAGTDIGAVIDGLMVRKSFGTDAARRLQSQSILIDPSISDHAKAMIDVFDKLLSIKNKDGTPKHTRKSLVAASQGVDFKSGKQILEFYRKIEPASFKEQVEEYRYINLLSSIKTQIINTTSNALQAGGLVPAGKLGRGAIKETGSYYAGAYRAKAQAWQGFKEVMKGDVRIERPDLSHLPTNSKNMFMRGGKYVLRLMEGSDVFFRTLIEQGETVALNQRVGAGKLKMTTRQIAKNAKQFAAENVFREELDPLGRGWKNERGQGHVLSGIDAVTKAVEAVRQIPGGKILIPFLRTGMSLAKRGVEYSPAGYTTMIGNKSPLTQFGKANVGTAILTYSAIKAFNGELTWASPASEKERKAMQEAGIPPYSIKFGGKWYSYQRLGPAAWPMAMAAAMNYHYKQAPSAITDDWLDKAGKMVGSAGQWFGDQTYMETVGNIIGAVEGRENAIARIASGSLGQYVPASSLQRWVNSMLDPIYRDTKDRSAVKKIGKELAGSVTGATYFLPPRLDSDGNPITKQNRFINAVSPVQVRTEDSSKVQDVTDLRNENAKNATERYVKALIERGDLEGATVVAGKWNLQYPSSPLDNIEELAQRIEINKQRRAVQKENRASVRQQSLGR